MSESNTDQTALTRRDALKQGLAAALGAVALSAVQSERAEAQVTERELEAPLTGGGTLVIGNFTDPASPFPDLFFVSDEQLEQFKLSETQKVEVFRGLRFGAGRFAPLSVESAFNLGLDGLVAQQPAPAADPDATGAKRVQQQGDAESTPRATAAQVDPDLIGPLVTVVSAGTVRREVERFFTVMT